MNFRYEPDEYIKNLAEYRALDETRFLPSESKRDVICKLKEIALKKKEIAQKQNDIIKEYIEPFEKGTEKLDKETAEKLGAFLNILFSEDRYPTDAAISLRLCRLLYSFFRGNKDREKTIDMIYMGTRSEIALSFYRSDSDFFEFPGLCEEHFPEFEELPELQQNELAEAYSYRVYSRTDEGYKKLPELYVRVERTIRECIDRAIDKSRIEHLFFVMNANFANFYCDMCRRNNIEKRKGNPPVFDTDQKAFKEQLLKNILRIEEKDEAAASAPYDILRIKNICYPVFYHMGIISFDEMMDKLDGLKIYGKKNGLGIIADLTITSHILTYLKECSPYEPEKTGQIARNRVNDLIPRILEIQKKKDRNYSWYIVAFLANSSFYGDFSEFYDIALDFTVYMDKALYIHTIMVRKICHLLLSRMIDEKPGFLNGVCGKDTAHISEHKEDMLELMDQCAMCHDIGKHFMIDVITNSSRKLTDDEFEIIKSHPKNFDIVYDQNYNESPEQKCIRDCALLHHRWHNGKGGYPEMPHTENRPFVDIIAIADSLDAATDPIGRPYGIGKTLDDLIAEFSDMSCTRYSKEVAEILSEPDIKTAVQEIITSCREDVNYRIYTSDHYEFRGTL